MSKGTLARHTAPASWLRALAGLAGLAILAAASAAAAEPLRAAFARERLALPDIPMVDSLGRPQQFHGPLTDNQIVVINFSYTTCDTICPLGNVVMAELDAALPADARVRLMSITIDPRNDTPDMMRAAAETFGASARWSWLTGAPADMDRLLRAFDADYANIVLHDPMFLIGRLDDGHFYRSLSMPSAEQLHRTIDAMAP